MFCDDPEEELISLPELQLGVLWKKFSKEKSRGMIFQKVGTM